MLGFFLKRGRFLTFFFLYLGLWTFCLSFSFWRRASIQRKFSDEDHFETCNIIKYLFSSEYTNLGLHQEVLQCLQHQTL